MQRSRAHLLRLLLCISSLTALLYPYAALAQTCEKPVQKWCQSRELWNRKGWVTRSGSRRNQ